MRQHRDEPDVCREIDGVPISDLARAHGSPLFVFSELTLRRTFRIADEAFRKRYADFQFAWSYKTNYLRAICATFHQEGAIAEVVSEFEYDKARASGIAGGDIILNGPYKPSALLERAVEDGAKIQIDHFDELEMLAAIADRRHQSIDVAIRVHLDAGVKPVWTKFGFNADTDEAMRAVEHIASGQRLRLVGLHTHIGTSIRSTRAFALATGKLIELAKAAHSRFGVNISYLNLGGGFPSGCMAQIGRGTTSIDDYAEAICSTIQLKWPKDAPRPRLYLESGRALVDDAGYLIGAVISAKYGSAGGGRCSYILDAGINLLTTAALSEHRVDLARACGGPLFESVLYGCLCMNTDVLRESILLPKLSPGDQLVFHPVGAYNLSQAMQFIAYRPRVVMIMRDGNVEVIREKESLAHLEALERVPDNLRCPLPRHFP